MFNNQVKIFNINEEISTFDKYFCRESKNLLSVASSIKYI